MVDCKSVVPKNLAEKTVMDYVPHRIEAKTPGAALDYLERKSQGSDFVMSKAIRIQTGVDKIEESNLDSKVEALVLERIKEVQESAYAKAYELGLEEGHNKAFKENDEMIKSALQSLDEMLTKMSHLKVDLIKFNESAVIDTVFQIGKSLALQSLQEDREAILKLLKDAAQIAESEEKVIVQVSPAQFEFIEKLKSESKKEFAHLQNLTLEANPEVQTGGCLIQTNYGEVDAQVEQRIKKLWDDLTEAKPSSKDKISA